MNGFRKLVDWLDRLDDRLLPTWGRHVTRIVGLVFGIPFTVEGIWDLFQERWVGAAWALPLGVLLVYLGLTKGRREVRPRKEPEGPGTP